MMLDYSSIAAVAAVIREGSFERGAAALGITPSAISQRVRGLEERLGAILIVRGQPCEPTELGRRLCDHLERVRLLEHDIAPALGKALGSGTKPLTVRIAVNADSLATWFPLAAATFGREQGVALDITLDDEAHTADRLRANEVIAAVTADPEPVQGCKTVRLGAMRYVACASPAFVERHFPQGVDADALQQAPHLQFSRRDAMQHRWASEAYGIELAAPVHWVPSTHGFLGLVLAGLGWSLQPLSLVRDHLNTGELTELEPGVRIAVALYWTAARLHATTLSRLTHAVIAAASNGLEADATV